VALTWFSRDDAIVMRSILVNAILLTLHMLNFANIGWVVDLGDVTSGGGSTQSISVSTSFRNGRTKKLVSYAS
jgi:hypothetical protein